MHDYFAGAVRHILALQMPDGAIPWFENGVVDPWNHLEAAMALNLMGETEAFARGLAYLRDTQLPDGSWVGQLGSAVPVDAELHQFTTEGMDMRHKVRDTNFIAYIATAIWHDYKLHKTRAATARHWDMVRDAIDFVLGLQSPEGEIRWTARDPQTPEEDALRAGNASIHKSLLCAIRLGEVLNADTRGWRVAREKLANALANKPERFDRTWESKARYSMDWYYPVLSGALSREQEAAQLASRWEDFVIDGYGCRCVDDEPWVTVAETAELVLALVAHGRHDDARAMLEWLEQFRDADGAYWMGMQIEQGVFWPVERPAWTAGAVILAYDAVHRISPAHNVLTARSETP